MTYVLSHPNPPLEEVLAHHGVKGMKWGVRKDRESSSSNKLPIPDHYMTRTLGSNEAAPLVILGAAYLAAALVAVTASHRDSGKKYQRRNKNVALKTNDDLSKKMSVNRLEKDVVKPINSNYGARGTKMNCRRCTFAFEMRRRGYDVKATPSKYATGQDQGGLRTATNTKTAYQSLWGQHQIGDRFTMSTANPGVKAEAVFSALSKEPNGARGELGVGWHFGGGHSMAWEIVNGKPVIFDTQNSTTYHNSHQFTKFASTMNDAAYTRLDNIELNDHFLKRWVQNT